MQTQVLFITGLKSGIATKKNYDDSRARFDLLKDKNWLRQRYLVDAVSIKTLATETGVSYRTVRKYLLLHGIELHKKHICLTKPIFDRPKGSDSPTWKGADLSAWIVVREWLADQRR